MANEQAALLYVLMNCAAQIPCMYLDLLHIMTNVAIVSMTATHCGLVAAECESGTSRGSALQTCSQW